jgi:hypothetical protein
MKQVTKKWKLLNPLKHSGYYMYLIHSLMELSTSWKAANCAATQELHNILWNPKVH